MIKCKYSSNIEEISPSVPGSFKEGIKDGIVENIVLPQFVIDALSPEANRFGMSLRDYFVYALCQKALSVINGAAPVLRNNGVKCTTDNIERSLDD